MAGQPITCKNTRKQLASIDSDALYLWCKRCNTSHIVTKKQLLELWGIPQQQVTRVDIHAMAV
jgi:hypothetical protein